MYKVVMLTLVSIVALLLSSCAGLTPAGGGLATQTPTAAVGSRAAISETQPVTATQAMTTEQASGMDHGAMQVAAAQPFDAQFIDSMIEHHQGAIEMAQQALEQAEHPELKQMAEAVIAAQAKEIEQMTAWRQSWYPDLPATGGMGMSMGEMAISTDESKPFDQRFMQAMISHHQGAIEMAQMAQHMAEHQEISTLADAILAAQQAEVEQMRGWLQEWYGVSQ
ncbi:MAG TPA: DUF305 domain-containing protein [Caldilineaceae bacterium]|nr:DUF305 domain-containing protein [Caldilineaceae bacterium]